MLRRRLVFWSSFTLLVVLAGATGGFVAAYMNDLPSLDLLEEYQPSLSTTLYSDQDEPFASLFEQKRIYVPLQKIPMHLVRALLAVEDARFYQHRGVDPRGIVRAIWTNLKCLCLAEGGSTITQQLAKVLFLTPEKSFSRKIKEILLAFEIERRYSKDKILELYLNQVYFGHGAYGVEAAAQTYFSKSVGQLTLAEAAMLAGLPRAPNYYSPILDKGRAKRRREHVLNRMTELGIITHKTAAETSKVPFDERRFAPSKNLAPYFVEYVRQQIEEKYGTYALYHGGLKVYTTLNLMMEKAAEEALIGSLREIDKGRGYRLKPKTKKTAKDRPSYIAPKLGEVLWGKVVKARPQGIEVEVDRYRGEIPNEKLSWTGLDKPWEAFDEEEQIKVRVLAIDEKRKTLELGLEQDPEVEGAFLAIDPRTGQIKAMVGGYDFERSKFNRAIQAKRQPGSAFKPFVYAAAFDRGFTPSTILVDSPVNYPILVNGQQREWSPENYDRTFRGPTTLRYGLEHSINVIAVKLIEKVGVRPVIELARTMGITSELRAEYALALGVSEVTLLEIVSAYGAFANRGNRMEPYAIRKVVDNRGTILEEHFPEGHQVLREETAFILTQVLRGVVERGTGKGARVIGRSLAAKTGTTQEATDAWFIGYTPSLVAGVWIGYDTKRSLGPHESSARLAVPIWVHFMQRILPILPEEDFPIPQNVVPITVNYQTGQPTSPEDKEGIVEFFIQGTEPRTIEAREPASSGKF